MLIRGETGTGKELVARAHPRGERAPHEPFVAVNCSALPGTLIESLIFGHERGAFTGADRRIRGQFELAGAGTLLLDEIAEMPVELQAKLLRVLEERPLPPPRRGDRACRCARASLAATHVDLEARIAEGRFREDLFYRLNVVTIALPSLAERAEDIPELVSAFASQLQRKLRFTEGAMAWLSRRPWPGNVRELRNVVERLALLAEDDIVDVPDPRGALRPDRGPCRRAPRSTAWRARCSRCPSGSAPSSTSSSAPSSTTPSRRAAGTRAPPRG